jgi:AP-2 complex subunit sigma-1
VYRRYAGLYFALCVDRGTVSSFWLFLFVLTFPGNLGTNELAALELIHLFVESLDTYFGSVCELDLVFNFFNCIQMWDELCLGGEPVETSRVELLKRMEMLKFLMKDSGKQKAVQKSGGF